MGTCRAKLPDPPRLVMWVLLGGRLGRVRLRTRLEGYHHVQDPAGLPRGGTECPRYRLFVGFDVGKRFHAAHARTGSGRRVLALKVDNDEAAVDAFVARAPEASTTVQPSTMFVRPSQAVPGLNLLGQNNASLRFNSDWIGRVNTRKSSTWGDVRS